MNLGMKLLVIVLVMSGLQCRSFVNSGYFWQVTDFHLDTNYSVHGDPTKMCHKSVQGSYSNSIFGNYLCDSPWQLVHSAVSAMKRIHSSPDFILWTGDSVPHVSNSLLNEEKVAKNIGNVTLLLQSTFPNTTIYPVLGNHDEYPADAFPKDNTTDYYEIILNVSHFNQILSAVAANQFKTGGYYTSLVHPGLRIIGLNTNLYYSQDKLTKDVPDPGGQFLWLEKTLTKARKSQQKVILMSHVPPGLFEKYSGLMWFYNTFNKKYLEILRSFSDIISAQIYGHEHTDSFRILKNLDGSPMSTLFLSPAVTPWKSTLSGVGANNPSIRLYTYNKADGTIQNYQQYFLNLSAVISGGNQNWTLEYDALNDYNLNDLSPTSLFSLADSFYTNSDGSMFRKYLTYNSVSQTLSPLCNQTCQLVHYCSITELDIEDFQLCKANTFQTTASPDRTTPHHRPKPVKKQYIYIIIALGAVVFILFIIVAVLCIHKRRHFVPHRFSRFSNALGSGPIN